MSIYDPIVPDPNWGTPTQANPSWYEDEEDDD